MDKAPPATNRDSERIDVRGDGRIILYKREGLKNPKWQARIRVPNATGYKIISTKAVRLGEAERIAIEVYDDLLQRVKSGGSLKSEPPRDCRRPFSLNYAAIGVSSSMA